MKKYIAYSLILLTATLSSCKKSFLDQTVNPNQPTVATPALVLTGALTTTARNINTGFTLEAYLMGYWSPAAGYAPNNSLLTYNFTTADYQVFTPYYLNLANYDYIIKQASADKSQTYFVSIAQIMEAYNFQILVDNYNNVPYSDAFQGAKGLTPKYDKGSDIYKSLIAKVDAAIAAIKGADPLVAVKPKASEDVMFKGDMTKWRKFANTLKLRLVLRQVPNVIDAAAAKTMMANTLSEGFLGSGEDATVNPGYSNIDSKQSPFWERYGANQAGSNAAPNITAGAFAVDFYNNNKDPRASLFYQPVGAAIVGNKFGTLVPITASNIGRIDLYGANANNQVGLLKNPGMDAVVLSAAESLFLQAEAVNRHIITSDKTDQQLYEAGITSSVVYAGGTAADAVKYYNQDGKVNVNWDSSTDKIQAIIVQKWASLNGYGNLEAYNDYRRTGFPNPPVSIYTGVTTKVIPSRILYPSSEYSQNAANVGAQGGINQFSSKIFWAKY